MMTDTLFDYAEGKRRQTAGITKVSSKHGEWLEKARACARDIALRYGEVSSDDIHAACPPPAGAHPNLMGAVFKTKEFVQVGWESSKRPSAHARAIRRYKLADQVS